MYGSERDIRHNLTLFFIDGVVFTPAMTLISVSTVIPYFLERLGASTFQIALAASVALICNFAAQPVFGYIASRSLKLHKTFGRILLFQRLVFLCFALSIPALAGSPPALIWIFLFFWGFFNVFVGSYNVFFTPLLLRLLPPDKRGAIRGVGFAIGSCLGFGAAALMRALLTRAAFPYNYVLIFSAGTVLLLTDAVLFLLMRGVKQPEKANPVTASEYLKGMPASVKNNPAFRAMILTCMFLVAANSMLSYYTLCAIRIFNASESHLSTLAALAVLASAAGYIAFGNIIDRRGPKTTALLAASFIIAAGAVALFSKSLGALFVAWALANFANSGYGTTASLLLGEVSPPEKLPMYVGVYTAISLALSSAVLLLLAPALERAGFGVLFAAVLICGASSFISNLFALRKRLSDSFEP